MLNSRIFHVNNGDKHYVVRKLSRLQKESVTILGLLGDTPSCGCSEGHHEMDLTHSTRIGENLIAPCFKISFVSMLLTTCVLL